MKSTEGVLITLILAGLTLAGPIEVHAQRIVRFAGSATNAKTGVDPGIRIDLLRWSTDEELTDVAGVFNESGEAGLAERLASSPTLGYVWTAESVGYSVRYAHRVEGPGGVDQIIFAIDRRIGTRNPFLWEPIGTSTGPQGVQDEAPEAAEFTLIELRLGAGSPGEGRVSLGDGVSLKATDGTIALDDYETAPVLLEDVTEEAS